jgi:hypothetical protein
LTPPNSKAFVYYGLTDAEKDNPPSNTDIFSHFRISIDKPTTPYRIYFNPEGLDGYSGGFGSATIAYPKSWGNLSSIKDENSFEMKNGMATFTTTYNGVEYLVYYQTNKAFYPHDFPYDYYW